MIVQVLASIQQWLVIACCSLGNIKLSEYAVKAASSIFTVCPGNIADSYLSG